MSTKNETLANYETSGDDFITRREVILMGALAAGSLVVSAQANAEPSAQGKTGAVYLAKDFSHLNAKSMAGFSTNQIDQHLKLYKGYINKANEIHNKLNEAETLGANATYSPFRELLVEQSYALNGVVYHEFYFGNLGGQGGEPKGEIRSAMEARWGTLAHFNDYMIAAGKSMRGWVILGFNTRDAHMELFGLDLHNMYVPANVVPLMVLDVYEHAYMIDYGIDRGKYLDAFCNNLDWDVVSKRFALCQKHPTGHAATT